MNDSSSCSPASACYTPNRRDFLRFTGISTGQPVTLTPEQSLKASA